MPVSNQDEAVSDGKICTEVETTAYKLPQYPEDLDCFTCTTPKTNKQIWQEVEEFMASASPDNYDEF